MVLFIIKWAKIKLYIFSPHDHLTIYDGPFSSLSPKLYCGDSLPPGQISSSNQLFFSFHSNQAGSATGFKLKYNAKSKNHYTELLGSGSEWAKDKAPLLTIVSFLKKKIKIKREKKILWVEVEIIPFHTVQNGRVILDKLPITFDTWFGVYILWIFINNN